MLLGAASRSIEVCRVSEADGGLGNFERQPVCNLGNHTAHFHEATIMKSVRSKIFKRHCAKGVEDGSEFRMAA